MPVDKMQLTGTELIDLIRIKHGYVILTNSIPLGNVRISKTEAIDKIITRNDYRVSVSDEKKYIGIWVAMPGEPDKPK